MVLLIPLVSTPTLSNAAESKPVSVSVEWTGGSAADPEFLLTVEHSDGSVSTGLIFVHVTGGYFMDQDYNQLTTLRRGKFSEVPSRPGVMVGVSDYSTNRVTLSDTGYAPSSACAPDANTPNTVCLTAALKDKPQTGTQILQMPTTGAPEGLTTAGIAALGIGVAGLLAAAVRRRA